MSLQKTGFFEEFINRLFLVTVILLIVGIFLTPPLRGGWVGLYNTPFVEGSSKLKISRLIAIFMAFASALKMASIL